MSYLSGIWSGEQTKVRQTAIAGGVVVLCGIALIILGVVENWGQTRLPGAVLITIGAAAGGAAVGFSQPARSGVWARLSSWRTWIALVCAVVIATPALLAMGSATLGPVVGGGDAKDTALVALGVFFGLIFTVGTALAAILSVHATRDRVARPSSSANGHSNAEESA